MYDADRNYWKYFEKRCDVCGKYSAATCRSRNLIQFVTLFL